MTDFNDRDCRRAAPTVKRPPCSQMALRVSAALRLTGGAPVDRPADDPVVATELQHAADVLHGDTSDDEVAKQAGNSLPSWCGVCQHALPQDRRMPSFWHCRLLQGASISDEAYGRPEVCPLGGPHATLRLEDRS